MPTDLTKEKEKKKVPREASQPDGVGGSGFRVCAEITMNIVAKPRVFDGSVSCLFFLVCKPFGDYDQRI
jgi:hypothetical protein